jgi:hypothetical protein
MDVTKCGVVLVCCSQIFTSIRTRLRVFPLTQMIFLSHHAPLDGAKPKGIKCQSAQKLLLTHSAPNPTPQILLHLQSAFHYVTFFPFASQHSGFKQSTLYHGFKLLSQSHLKQHLGRALEGPKTHFACSLYLKQMVSREQTHRYGGFLAVEGSSPCYSLNQTEAEGKL